MKDRLILISNDDGIHSQGIVALEKALKGLGEIYIVAPDGERSASSHSITLHRPLRVKQVRKRVFAADGTPADCVLLATRGLLPKKPDIVVSGINHGPNVSDDVHYSGTVSVAREAAVLGIPAIAISAIPKVEGGSLSERTRYPFNTAAKVARRIVQLVLRNGLTRGVFLNVNVPYGGRHIEITRLGKRNYGRGFAEKSDPTGRKYYWLTSESLSFYNIQGSDGNAVSANKISVTPLKVDATDYKSLLEISKWKLN